MREQEADLGMPEATASEISMQDLGRKRVVAKFVPQLLLPGQKDRCAAVANDAGRTVSGPKVPTLKGTEHSVLCTMFPIPCIVFHKCLYFLYYMACVTYIIDESHILKKNILVKNIRYL